eukprot:360877-Chlamydomonas_euryale.AAC.5
MPVQTMGGLDAHSRGHTTAGRPPHSASVCTHVNTHAVGLGLWGERCCFFSCAGVPDVAAGPKQGAAMPQSQPAEVVFVVCTDEPGRLPEPHELREMRTEVCRAFGSSSLLVQPEMAINVVGDVGAGSTSSAPPSSAGKAGQATDVHFWALTHPRALWAAEPGTGLAGPDTWRCSRGTDCTTSLWHRLAGRLLAHPRRAFSRPVGERDWLAGCARAWASIQTSPMLRDFLELMLQTNYMH